MQQRIDEFQIDQLKEIMNIGASHASTALSQMIHKKVDLSVPRAYVDEIQNLSKFIENKDEEVTTAILKIYGDASGVMFFMFSDGDESKIATILMDDVDCAGSQKELEVSAVKEVGNIMAGASLSAFSKFLNMSLLHSVADVVVDTADSIMNSVAVEIGKVSGVVLIFEVKFNIKELNVGTKFLFIVDPAATAKLLAAIEDKYK
ncbi:chemotaxis protein CheC [Candidatus Parcubacteria bacterium]|nr:chemotaxis protein CheC [Patescibacteria group bacterium]MBU4309382.1 chemotaxis protein CheC [Patescibacteria group bacterium]MBU4432511.1 chemotaxis protein CheC [Patescibacteria group bacterium]MBU4577743.1 chemotaxis protein CheC [Patescibacteria group bacterium]MCG2697428.1 chemotaxis protein CheC [Candidatus Parcubacteria bacterium]